MPCKHDAFFCSPAGGNPARQIQRFASRHSRGVYSHHPVLKLARADNHFGLLRVPLQDQVAKVWGFVEGFGWGVVSKCMASYRVHLLYVKRTAEKGRRRGGRERCAPHVSLCHF